MEIKTGELLPVVKARRKTGIELAEKRSLTPEAQRRRAELCRERIKTNLLIDKLQNHALNKRNSAMTPTQVQAAQALLRKTIPDLVGSKVELDASPIVFNFNIRATKE